MGTIQTHFGTQFPRPPQRFHSTKVLQVSLSSQAYALEEPHFISQFITSKAPLRARAKVQEAMEFSEVVAISLVFPDFSVFPMCKRTL